METLETYIVDSFTDKAFCGNPAAVCLLKKPISDSLMLNIAKELGLSETAFVLQQTGENEFSIRYFSPKMEIPLCGHATLAASKVLFEILKNTLQLQFITASNTALMAKKSGDDIVMEFPSYSTKAYNTSNELLLALGIDKVENCRHNTENNILLLEIESSTLLRALKPDFNKLLQSDNSINGVLVTAISNKKSFDFESRYFWPWSGTNEDPVTGATHTFLAKYWGEKLNKKVMNSYQSSERGGFMEVELVDINRINIKSKARIVLRGNLEI